MPKISKLHNDTLYKVTLDVTNRYTLYLNATTKAGLDNEVKHVVNSDMYQMTTDSKPLTISYSYSADYITCEQSFEEFINEQVD